MIVRRAERHNRLLHNIDSTLCSRRSKPKAATNLGRSRRPFRAHQILQHPNKKATRNKQKTISQHCRHHGALRHAATAASALRSRDFVRSCSIHVEQNARCGAGLSFIHQGCLNAVPAARPPASFFSFFIPPNRRKVKQRRLLLL